MKELIKHLCEFPVVSGREKALLCEIAGLLPEYNGIFDTMGNLILCRRKEIPEKPLVFAVGVAIPGFYFTAAEEDGRLRVAASDTLGDSTRYVGRTFCFRNISGKLCKDNTASEPRVTDLYLDCGFTSRREAENTLMAGAPFAPIIDLNFTEEKNAEGLNGAFVSATASLVRAAQNTKNDSAVFCFTTANLVGGRGMKAITNRLLPGVGFVIKNIGADSELPTILYKDRQAFSDLYCARRCEEILTKNKIKYSVSIDENGYSEARQMQISGIGTRTVSLCLPALNFGSYNETVSLTTAQNFSDAISAIADNF